MVNRRDIGALIVCVIATIILMPMQSATAETGRVAIVCTGAHCRE
jgi:hypothetical protein